MHPDPRDAHDKALKNMEAALKHKSCWEEGISDPQSGAPLDRRMTSWETKEIKGWMKTEARGREAESSTQQPAGKRETTVAAAKATATVTATRNSPPLPSRDLATMIMTTTVNDHAAGDALPINTYMLVTIPRNLHYRYCTLQYWYCNFSLSFLVM